MWDPSQLPFFFTMLSSCEREKKAREEKSFKLEIRANYKLFIVTFMFTFFFLFLFKMKGSPTCDPL
jgi:hypothetical protein